MEYEFSLRFRLPVDALGPEVLVERLGEMGCTVRRLFGLVDGVAGYGVVLVFLCWAVWPPRKEQEP
ncbi:MAG: hypothetical protein ACOYMX_08965 [Burkholderiales bacterium]